MPQTNLRAAQKSKWLVIYTNPKGWHYYRYGKTIGELKVWAKDREGSFALYGLTYAAKRSWRHPSEPPVRLLRARPKNVRRKRGKR